MPASPSAATAPSQATFSKLLNLLFYACTVIWTNQKFINREMGKKKYKIKWIWFNRKKATHENLYANAMCVFVDICIIFNLLIYLFDIHKFYVDLCSIGWLARSTHSRNHHHHHQHILPLLLLRPATRPHSNYNEIE